MKKELLIRYKDSVGNITERRISDIMLESSRTIDAYCHLREARRSFSFEGIISASDANTGEVISDIRSLFGLRKPKESQVTMPADNQTHDFRHSSELYKGQRQKEKYEFSKPYYTRVIYDLYKNRLFDLFGQRCFKCGALPPLVFDHHIPMILGGKLEPGNIVALCPRCNGIKHDKPPDSFYTKDELHRLKPILEQEKSVLDFELDWSAWCADRKSYLLSLGVDPSLVDEVLVNPDHPHYVGDTSHDTSLTISVNITDDDNKDAI